MSDHQPRLLVTGASGQLGQRVLELLLEAKAGQIIAATRTPDKLADFAEQGVIVRYADFDDAASLANAFAGVDRLLLISTDAMGGDKRLNQHVAAVKAAEAAGVKHVIYTSLIEATNTPVLLAPDHAGTERALAESSMGWTILRNNIYMDLLVPTLNQAFSMGGLFNAAGDGKTAYVTREDCARVAAAALASSFDRTQILDITGSEALSQSDIAQLASQITGQTLNYIPLELDALIEGMVGAGLPHPAAEVYASFDTATAQGKFQVVSNTLEELTGQPPIRLADLLVAHKDALLPTTAVH